MVDKILIKNKVTETFLKNFYKILQNSLNDISTKIYSVSSAIFCNYNKKNIYEYFI